MIFCPYSFELFFIIKPIRRHPPSHPTQKQANKLKSFEKRARVAMISDIILVI